MNRVHLWIGATLIASAAVLGHCAGKAAEPDAAPPVACEEDQPCWDCRSAGDRVCGPGNDQGLTPGCYDDTGALVAGWPCRVVVDPVTGEGDVYIGLVDPLLPTRGLGGMEVSRG